MGADTVQEVEERGAVRDRDAGEPRGLDRDTMVEARTRQHEEFGGFNLGATLLGWLVAGGIAAILTAVLGAAGTATGLTDTTGPSPETIGIAGGVLLLLILMLAYYTGGYNAGRLSRFDGARQGLGVWLLGLIVTILLGFAGVVFGPEYNVLERLNLPRIPIDEGSLATGGLIALVAIALGTLVAAMAGGKAGERYHRKVDRAALER